MNFNVNFSSLEEVYEFCRAFQGSVDKDEKNQKPLEATAQMSAAPVASVAALEPTTTVAPIQTAVPTAPEVTVPTIAPISQTTVPTAQPQTVPTSEQTYSSDDLAQAAMTLIDAGRMMELQQLLAQFGVASLPELQESQRGAFATALRGMGAKI